MDDYKKACEDILNCL